MTDTKKKLEKPALKTDTAKLLQEMKEFSLTVGEECPEGHRRDVKSGACLPMGSIDHTAFTRSLNDEQGPRWRGLEDKPNETFAAELKELALMDAGDMDELVSCGGGTTFSFVKRACITLEEAEAEDNDDLEAEAETEVADDLKTSEEPRMKQPIGRRDTPNHECPPDQFFNFARRQCIPLNKSTVMASEEIDAEFKKAVAHSISGKLGVTSPDPLDGHTHLVTLDEEGNGTTSVTSSYSGTESYGHSHEVSDYQVQDYTDGDYTSRHFGYVIPKNIWEYEDDEEDDSPVAVMARAEWAETLDCEGEFAKELRSKQRNALPSGSFGVPGKRKFPLHDCNHVRNAMSRFNQAKGLTSAEKSTLRGKIMSAAKKCGIKTDAFHNASTDEDFALVAQEQQEILKTVAAPIKTKQRNALPTSSFGVPGKRKFPLDSCGRVRNAMARFNQAKGLSSSEKATLRRKIMAAAKKCGIEVKKFASATTTEEFASVINELLLKERIVTQYAAKEEPKKDAKKGPCPPWMEWDPKAKKCGKMKGFHEIIKSQAQATNPDPTSKDPAGRKDTPGFKCPKGEFFDFKNRKCLPLDPADKEGRQPGDTTKASSSGEKDLVPQPEGRPARLADDCPPGMIWIAYRKACKQLDTSKVPDEAGSEFAKIPQGGPGVGKDINGCYPGEYFDAKSKKCLKGSNKAEVADNREGLTPAPAGKVRLPEDCPKGTLWDGINKLCRPLDSRDKNRPSGKSPEDPKNTAEVDAMTIAHLIKVLDEILKSSADQKEKTKIMAKELPNEAFPPSLVSSTRRSLMHHTPEVADAYDNETVDVARLRNALARMDTVEGYSAPAVEDAKNHLLYHAREIVKAHLGKN
jgi:hypothetical protein